jgi:GxxExxY protein
MDENELSNKIIGAAIEVHKHLGPGLLESAYEECMCHELNLMGLSFERQKNLPVEYKGIKLDCGYRMDLVVDNKVLIEIKAIDKLMPIHEAQVLTYLKLSGLKLGMLINFNNALIRDGIKRVVLGLRAPLKLVDDEQGSEPKKKP